MIRVRILPCLVLTVAAAAAHSAATPPADDKTPAPPAATKSFDAAAIDKTADPCTDFYQYACGNWVKDNPVPADQTRWARSFSLLAERNRYLLWKELLKAASDPRTPLQKKYGDFYAACMNTRSGRTRRASSRLSACEAHCGPQEHRATCGASWESSRPTARPAPLFRFGVGQDQKDSTKQIAEIGAGRPLPARPRLLPRRSPRLPRSASNMSST